LKKFLNNYFGFNKQQRGGLLVLCVISFLLLLVRLIYPLFMVADKIIIENLPLIEEKLDSTYSNSKKYYSQNKGYENYDNNYTNSKLNLFAFNPNTITVENLIKLGFREKTAGTLVKFRSKGFKFRKKEDLKKIYGISEYFYQKLEPYILLDTPSELKPNDTQKITFEKSKNKTQEIVELNSADSVQLQNLKGIGASFSKRILKYREILSGYVNVNQLKEVYGFTEELFETIKPFVKVDASVVTKININTADFKAINKSPYISYELTKIIVDARKKTLITETSLKDLMADESLYQKLIPYINF
jgi:competence protein ComEA